MNFFNQIGLPGLIIILIVVLIFFGPSKLPELAKSLGKTVKEFKKGISEVEKDIKEVKEDLKKDDGKTEEGTAPENKQ